MTEIGARTADFEAVALPHLDLLYRVARRYTRDAARAEDLVQDTVLKALTHWESFRPGSNVRAWLLTILRNTFVSGYRRSRREAVSVEPEVLDRVSTRPEAADDPAGEFFARITDERILGAVEELPDDFREVVVLSDIEGMSYAEIAQALGVPVGTVKSRLFRARQRLQAELLDYAVGMGWIRPRTGA
jgi:RNA polymerase sigma-70 factor (ECF subfamily)